MARGLVRTAAYLPRFTGGAGRMRGFDEDATTLAAAALELATGDDPRIDRELRIDTVGIPEPADPVLLAAVLGGTTAVSKPSSAPLGLHEALLEALGSSGPAWVVATAVQADEPEPHPLPFPGEGAAALLIDDRPEADPQVLAAILDRARAGARTPLEPLFAQYREAPGRSVWSGPWRDAPGSGVAPPFPGGRRPVSSSTVSQGAFVPPSRDEESRRSRWAFLADRCDTCGVRTFPARGRCRDCGETLRLRPERLPRRGLTVVARTWIGQGGQPTEFDPQVEACGPYGVVLADAAPDVRVTLAVADLAPEQVTVGSKVDTAFRRLYSIDGLWRYGRKAVPVRPEDGS